MGHDAKLMKWMSRIVITVSLPEGMCDERSGSVVGVYENFDDDVLALASINGCVYVYAGGVFIEPDDSMLWEYEKYGAKRSLCLEKDGMRFEYVCALEDEPVSTLAYSEDDEDVDFLLWVNNILESPVRKRIFANNIGKR